MEQQIVGLAIGASVATAFHNLGRVGLLPVKVWVSLVFFALFDL